MAAGSGEVKIWPWQMIGGRGGRDRHAAARRSAVGARRRGVRSLELSGYVTATIEESGKREIGEMWMMERMMGGWPEGLSLIHI